jgi:heme/copper-type cytochrome/quinol oxidase subunit 4
VLPGHTPWRIKVSGVILLVAGIQFVVLLVAAMALRRTQSSRVALSTFGTATLLFWIALAYWLGNHYFV